MILQSAIPYDVFGPDRLPGTRPVAMADWLITDDAYAAQMAERVLLLEQRRQDVVALLPAAQPAAQEALTIALSHVPEKFSRATNAPEADVICPDGRRVAIDRKDPLGTLGRIFQEDFCLMEHHGDEYCLTGAVLCFPAIWRLAEKLGRPMTTIHEPVESFDTGVAQRVGRLFDGLQVGRPLWRYNARWYDDPALFQPWSATATFDRHEQGTSPYLRSERQCLIRLPETRAVLFTIHTFVVRVADAFPDRSAPQGG